MRENSPTVFETLAIGDEILTGKISDTNSSFLGQQLLERGHLLSRQTVVADKTDQIRSAIFECAKTSEVVFCFGGLGPTSDDLTVDCVSQILDCESVLHEPSRERLVSYYRSRNREVNARALRQVRYPQKAVPFTNPVGLAPGFHFKVESCSFYCLPGVPSEMRALVRECVFPHLEQQNGENNAALQSRVWRCLGIAESDLQTRLEEFEASLPHGAYLGYRTVFPENHVSLYVRRSLDQFDSLAGRLQEIVAPWFYDNGQTELEAHVVNLLRERGYRIALAESCTAGLVTQRLSRVPGASEVLWGGVVCYQLEAKKRLLGVAMENTTAAVSSNCTNRLAKAIRTMSGVELGVAVTGYMGPDGGTAQDPLGTIYVASNVGNRCHEKRLVAPGRERTSRQWAASSFVLDQIRRSLH